MKSHDALREPVAELSMAPIVTTSTAPELSPRSLPLAEAQRHAKDAILDLWGHGVRFADYLNAGIDKRILAQLFDNLKLSQEGQTSAQPGSDLNKDGLTRLSTDSRLVDIRDYADPSAITPISHTDASALTKAQENDQERRPSSAVVEKQKNLQVKLEALRKSREDRAQKKAAKDNLSSPLTSNISVNRTPLTSSMQMDSGGGKISSPQSPATELSTQQSSSHKTMPVVHRNPPEIEKAKPVIPGLHLFANTPTGDVAMKSPAHVITNPRKRPVAADLYGPDVRLPVKRPFGQSRDGQALVIDVSEEGASDDDVAMDLDSQIDADSPMDLARKSSDHAVLEPRGQIRGSMAIPPTPQATPGLAPSPPVPVKKQSIKDRSHLHRREQEIEALKRRIVDMQLKKRSRSIKATASEVDTIDSSAEQVSFVASGTTTPAVADATAKASNPEVGSGLSSEAPKEHEIVSKPDPSKEEALKKRLRREKIAATLPHVDVDLQRKRRKLEALEDEQALLKASLQKTLADKKTLVAELNRLDLQLVTLHQSSVPAVEPLEPPQGKQRFHRHVAWHLRQWNSADCPDRDDGPSAIAQTPSTSRPISSPTQQSQPSREKSPSIVSSTEEGLTQSRHDSPQAKPFTPAVLEDTMQVDQASEHDTDKEVSDDAPQAEQQAPSLPSLEDPPISQATPAEQLSVQVSNIEPDDPDQSSSQDMDMEEGELSSAYSPVLERSNAKQFEGEESDSYEPPEAGPVSDHKSRPERSSHSPVLPATEEASFSPDKQQSKSPVRVASPHSDENKQKQALIERDSITVPSVSTYRSNSPGNANARSSQKGKLLPNPCTLLHT